MIDDDERNWKQKFEAKAVEDFSRLWGRCAAAGFVAILIAPLALFVVLICAEGLRRWHWPIDVTLGQFLGGLSYIYGMTLLFSLPASIPCAIVYAIAVCKLRAMGYFNGWISAVMGAFIGILASVLVSVTIFAGKAPQILDPHAVALMAPVGALTTLAAYLLCLRRL